MALWSINERLNGNIGVELEKPSQRQMDDLLGIMRNEVKQAKDGKLPLSIEDLL